MADAVYGRPVGVNLETAVNRAVQLVKKSLTDPEYQVLVSACRDREDRGAWMQKIDGAVGWRRGGGKDAKYNGKMRISYLIENLAQAEAGVGKYAFEFEDGQERWYRLTMPEEYKTRTDIVARKAQEKQLTDLQTRMKSDIHKCWLEANEYAAYCTRMDEYEGWLPKRKWATCNLSNHLQRCGIAPKDAPLICKLHGASEVAYLEYVDIHDNVRVLNIDNNSKMILQELVQKSSVILPKDTGETALQRKQALANPRTRMVQMRELVEAL